MKRGSIFDIIVIITLLLGFSITLVFGFFILKTEKDTFPYDKFDPIIEDQVDRIITYYKFFDYGTMILFVSLSIASILLARNIPTHPAFFVISVISLIIISFVVYVVQEVYTAIASQTSLAPYANEFPLTGFLMSNLGYYFLGLSIIILLVMYTRGESVSVPI